MADSHASRSPGPLAFRIDPLPDFLLDHTLSEERSTDRLREIVSRWVQFVGALWRWNGSASFALRFTCDTAMVRPFLLANPRDESDIASLGHDLRVLGRSHGLPLQEAGGERDDPESPFWDLGGSRVFAEVRQHENRRLWPIPKRAQSSVSFKKEMAWLPPSYIEETPHLFPWWAPGGPFLLPFEKLVSQPGPCSITAYLSPAQLSTEAWNWLSFVSRTAQSVGDFQEQAIGQAFSERRVDPAASLAGRLAMANLRRLCDKPFLVSVQCAAGAGNEVAARSLAGTVESIVYERPFDRTTQEDDRLPSAADTRVIRSGPEHAAAEAQHERLHFDPILGDDPLAMLPYLADARGAATVFRLPVNIRGGVPGCRVRQRPPDFHPGPRAAALRNGEILIGELHQGGLATVDRNAFTKHALVTGFTGSGKTVTVLGLVHQLHASGVPVLVIESAKQEYRSLLGVDAFRDPASPLLVFTAGNEVCAPLRLNPFEILPGTRLEAHVSRLQTCFEAALPPIGPLASMIGEAIVDIYERLGWRLTDIGPEHGETLRLRFPSMRDFFERMSELPKERGYEGEVRSNVAAAVMGRIKPLAVGTKGLMFRGDLEQQPGQQRRPSLISKLLSQSSVVEMNDLNIEDKALVTMFLLTFLREHRERHASTDGTLVHATVVEEAHNVLENVASTGGQEGGGADTRYKAVQAFSQMLTEIRALGQSLIIVDQSPEKLAPDALRNTNIQIAHQLRDSHDRESVARAMIMEESQRDYLGKLEPGQAAVFMTGLERATFVRVPRYDGRLPGETGRAPADLRIPGDDEVKEHMRPVTEQYRSGPFGEACRDCTVRQTCEHRPEILGALTRTPELADRFASVAGAYRSDRSVDRAVTAARLVELSISAARAEEQSVPASRVWCAFVHLWHRDRFNWNQRFPSYAYETVTRLSACTRSNTDHERELAAVGESSRNGLGTE